MMKKILALILAFAMCLSLCACGGSNSGADKAEPEQSDTVEEPEIIEEPEVIVEKLSLDDLVGTWTKSLWFYPTQLVINQNSTYDYGSGKGTFTFSETDFTVSVDAKQGKSPGGFKYMDGYLYNTAERFEEDDDYGLPFSPDENGRTEQEFSKNYTSESTYKFDPAVKESTFTLILSKDGTFVARTAELRYSSSVGYYVWDSITTYKGTYSYKDSILTLTYEGTDYPLVVVDGIIYFLTYHK